MVCARALSFLHRKICAVWEPSIIIMNVAILHPTESTVWAVACACSNVRCDPYSVWLSLCAVVLWCSILGFLLCMIMTHQGMPIHSHLILLSHCGLIQAQRVELVCTSQSPLKKRKKKGTDGYWYSSNFPLKILTCEEKASATMNMTVQFTDGCSVVLNESYRMWKWLFASMHPGAPHCVWTWLHAAASSCSVIWNDSFGVSL